MNKTLIFALREYKASVKTKGFIIGLILAPIFMGGSLITFALLKDRVDTTDKTVVIMDRSCGHDRQNRGDHGSIGCDRPGSVGGC